MTDDSWIFTRKPGNDPKCTHPHSGTKMPDGPFGESWDYCDICGAQYNYKKAEERKPEWSLIGKKVVKLAYGGQICPRCHNQEWTSVPDPEDDSQEAYAKNIKNYVQCTKCNGYAFYETPNRFL